MKVVVNTESEEREVLGEFARSEEDSIAYWAEEDPDGEVMTISTFHEGDLVEIETRSGEIVLGRVFVSENAAWSDVSEVAVIRKVGEEVSEESC